MGERAGTEACAVGCDMGLFKVGAERLGVHRHLRYSRLYDWYAQVRNSGYAAVLASDRRFYRELFRAHGVSRVFDVGANVGDKARVFRELAPRVVCVEPDPDLAEVLRFRFRGKTGIVMEVAAVGSEPGSARLHRKVFPGFNTLSDKWSETTAALDIPVPARDVIDVPVTTLDLLIEAHGRPDYLKIDVEGFELAGRPRAVNAGSGDQLRVQPPDPAGRNRGSSRPAPRTIPE